MLKYILDHQWHFIISWAQSLPDKMNFVVPITDCIWCKDYGWLCSQDEYNVFWVMFGPINQSTLMLIFNHDNGIEYALPMKYKSYNYSFIITEIIQAVIQEIAHGKWARNCGWYALVCMFISPMKFQGRYKHCVVKNVCCLSVELCYITFNTNNIFDNTK